MESSQLPTPSPPPPEPKKRKRGRTLSTDESALKTSQEHLCMQVVFLSVRDLKFRILDVLGYVWVCALGCVRLGVRLGVHA